MNKENIKKRLRNWKTWLAFFSLAGFLFSKFGLPEAKSFLDEAVPYIFTLGITLGIWTDHDEKPKGDVE